MISAKMAAVNDRIARALAIGAFIVFSAVVFMHGLEAVLSGKSWP